MDKSRKKEGVHPRNKCTPSTKTINNQRDSDDREADYLDQENDSSDIPSQIFHFHFFRNAANVLHNYYLEVLS